MQDMPEEEICLWDLQCPREPFFPVGHFILLQLDIAIDLCCLPPGVLAARYNRPKFFFIENSLVKKSHHHKQVIYSHDSTFPVFILLYICAIIVFCLYNNIFKTQNLALIFIGDILKNKFQQTLCCERNFVQFQKGCQKLEEAYTSPINYRYAQLISTSVCSSSALCHLSLIFAFIALIAQIPNSTLGLLAITHPHNQPLAAVLF